MVTKYELNAVLFETETDLKDRPLTSNSNSVHDPQPLMPSQLMHRCRLDSTPVAVHDPEEDDNPTMFNTELLSRR